jgi:imidazolonepropionase-like amidohydrolase
MRKIWFWGLRSIFSLALLVALTVTGLWLYPKLHGVAGTAAVPALALAYTHVNVLNPGEAEMLDRTVLVEAGHFTRILPGDAPVPAGLRVIDASGNWLLPGLIDVHVHVIDEADMALLLAHGVTTVRNMLGMPIHLRLRAALAAGEIAGPRLYSAGPILDTPARSGSFHQTVNTPAQARAAVRATKAAGFDLVKVYDGVSAEVFAAIVDEARAQGMPVAGHIPAAVPLREVLASYVSVEHVEELWQNGLKQADRAERAAITLELRSSGKPLVASLQIIHRLAQVCGGGAVALAALPRSQINPVLAYVGGKSVAGWADGSEGCDDWRTQVQQMAALVEQLQRAGVGIAVGSDSGPHLTVHGAATLDEIDQLYAAGLPTEAVLAAATRTAALVLGRSAELGRIAPGYLADAVLLNADPRLNLAVLRSPEGVLAQGRWYDTAARERLMQAGSEHAGVLLTLGRMLEAL